ncbi:ABC transporter substrate-binding protein [Nocardioides humi]|uniref:ABC transporter substrate-binding protein n=1 Tax=Nocardioides humi TaxID=449461 RepID=A0ABN2A1G0_9ACTN|nr:ABC transporter substrate-binding protein [Nocardioides humi]
MTELYFTRCPVPTATTLAARTGMLDAELAPLEVRIASLQAAGNEHLLPHHFDHGLPGLIREGGNIPALWARASSVPTRLVGVTWVDEYQVILAARDSGIAGAADLAGRRIGLPRTQGRVVDIEHAMALRGFERALSLAALTLEDVVPVELDPVSIDVTRTGLGQESYAAARVALAEGVVDAVWVKGAAGMRIRRELDAVVVSDLGAHPDPAMRINNGTPRTVTVHAELLERRPEVVTRYLVGLLRAARWAESGGSEVGAALAAETGGSDGDVAAAYGRGPFVSFAPRLDDPVLDALRDQERFLAGHGFVPAPAGGSATWDEWVVTEPLRAAEKLVADARLEASA